MQRPIFPFSFSRASLRFKVSLGIVLPLLVILGTFTFLEYQQLRRMILSQLSLVASQTGQVIEDNLRQQMLKNDFTTIQQTLDSIGESEGFEAVYLLNPQGKVIFSPHGENVGRMLDKSTPDCQACHALPLEQRYQSVVVTTENNTDVFRSMKPIENSPACSQCHDPKQRLIGLLLIDISTGPLENSLNRELNRNLIWWGATILLVLTVVNLVLNLFVLRPLEGFSTAFADMSAGQQPPPLPSHSEDEIGKLAQNFNRMAKEVVTRQEENQALSDSLRSQNMQRGELLKRLITAQEDERKRIARDLHDTLGQSLSALSLHTETILRFLHLDTGRAQAQTERVKQLSIDTINQMHELIAALRPSELDDLGLVPALRHYTERLFQESATRYTFQVEQMAERLPGFIETSLYRTFQEALNNVARHAHASQVEIVLHTDKEGFWGEIRDDGRGFDPDSVLASSSDDARGIGLLGMRERVALCGGYLEIQSSPGAGTKVKIFIPVSEINDG